VAALDADGLNNLALSFRDLGRDEPKPMPPWPTSRDGAAAMPKP